MSELSIDPVKRRGASLGIARRRPKSSKELTAHTVVVATEIRTRDGSLAQHFLGHPGFEHGGVAVQMNDVSVLNFFQRPAGQTFRRDVDGRGYRTGCAGHAAISDQRNLESLALQ